MLKVCNLNIERRKEIHKRLKEFIRKLKERFSIKEVYLYGSFAKHEFSEASDIDLIIIGDFKGRMFERIGEILELTDLPIEPLVYTPKEFQKIKKESPFLREVIKTAKRYEPK